MDIQGVPQDPAREPARPGTRSGEGTETLWEHMARDELQKTNNRGAGQRESLAPRQEVHPGRRSTDRR